MHTPSYGRRINTIGSIECEDVTLLPFVQCLEAFSELEGRVANLGIGIVSGGNGIGVDNCFGFDCQSLDSAQAIEGGNEGPLSSGKGLSLRSNMKAQRSTFGMSSRGSVDSVGIVAG